MYMYTYTDDRHDAAEVRSRGRRGCQRYAAMLYSYNAIFINMYKAIYIHTAYCLYSTYILASASLSFTVLY